jgi:hypothetical protein
MDVKLKDLKSVADELTEVMGLSPEIDTNLPEDELLAKVREAIEQIEPTDEFTKKTQGIIDALKAEKKPARGKKPDPEPVPDVEEDPLDDLEDEINDAEKLNELKDICKGNDEFKMLRGILSKYKTADDLRDGMLEVIEKLREKKTEDKPTAGTKKEKEKKEEKKPIEKGKKKEAKISPYGSAVEVMCTDPEMTMEELVKRLLKKQVDVEAGKAAIRTARGVVRSIVGLLRKNKLME